MKLYLARHGDALSKATDKARSLSSIGKDEVEKTASFLGRCGVKVSRVVHSGKTRARQTAELLAESIAKGVAVETGSGLDPMDPVKPIANKAKGWTKDTLLVGHLPFMGKLASLLLTGNENLDIVSFHSGSVACLKKNGEESWTLAWVLSPELLP